MALTQNGVVLVRELDTNAFSFNDGTKKIGVKSGVTDAALNGTNLEITLADGTKKVANLAGLIPAQKADHFLKSVVRTGNKIVFTVGAAGTTDGQTTFEVDVADLAPVAADGVTIEGTGVGTDKLRVKDGVIGEQAKAAATITLNSAFGDPIGKIFPV